MIELTITQIVQKPNLLRDGLKSGDVRIVWREQKPGGKIVESAIVRKEKV